MVEILPPGTEAETCGLPAGSGFNGLRGFVICYDASKGRYLFEDDAATTTMSLRAKNLRVLEDEPEQNEEKAAHENENSGWSDREALVDPSGSHRDLTIVEEEKNAGPKILYCNDIVAYHSASTGETKRAIVTKVDYVGFEPSYTIRLLDSGLQKITSGTPLSLVRAVSIPPKQNQLLRIVRASVVKTSDSITGWTTPTTIYVVCLLLACMRHIELYDIEREYQTVILDLRAIISGLLCLVFWGFVVRYQAYR